jgi:hypothetical protein
MKRSLKTPQAPEAPRRLQDLPAESECPQRKSTGLFAGTIKIIAEKIPFSTI